MTQDIITTAGIDASKATLDIAVHGCVERWQVVNALPGWRALATKLATAGVARVGIEATGGYERGIVRYLRAAGFTVLVLQPIQTRAYARVCLRRAKNDALDAALIAACAANLDPARIEPDPRLADLVGHLSFVEQIEADIARFKTRLEHVDDRRLRRLIINDIARLKARRNAELRRIGERLRAHDDLALRLDLVLSVPGIGERTAIALIVRMPELGHVSREQAAALAGLAPFDNDSGKHKGQRRIAGGRAIAPLPVRRRIACRLPLEQGADRPLLPPHRLRKTSQRGAHRLCQKTPHLGQHRRPAQNALDRKNRPHLMVATRAVRSCGVSAWAGRGLAEAAHQPADPVVPQGSRIIDLPISDLPSSALRQKDTKS